MKYAFLLILPLLFFLLPEKQSNLLLPISDGEIIKHRAFTLAYNEQHEQAEWVFYYLDSSRITGNHNRTNDFRPDELVSTGSADLNDYRGSGFDRGHLCPAADNKQSLITMSESFLMSNMSPQRPGFNRGIWKQLEEQFRSWALMYKGIYVVTSGILTDSLKNIGINNVSIPDYYYKIAYSPLNNQMIAFVLPNESSSEPLWQYCISVDSVETLTGIDFFKGLHGENTLEASVENEKWDFKLIKSWKNSENPDRQEKFSHQCKGISKSTGTRCQNTTKNPNGYCHLHQDQAHH